MSDNLIPVEQGIGTRRLCCKQSSARDDLRDPWVCELREMRNYKRHKSVLVKDGLNSLGERNSTTLYDYV